MEAESFNATGFEYSENRLIHELFEEQVRQTPNVVAVKYGRSHLTYAELNCRSNQLARYLVNNGVGADRPVGICVERGLDMLIGVLGILKAGGAYLPLDPNYPPERLRHMIEDAAPQLVLTQEELRAALPDASVDVILLKRKLRELADYIGENLAADELDLNSRHLVYTIYTSGSTGRPKGIAMPHRSMVNLIEWHGRTFNTPAGHRVLQFASLSFDVAFQEIFSTLCAGGTLVLLGEWVRRDVKALAILLSEESIERLFVPPLMLQSLAEYYDLTNTAPAGLQNVITAGEQLRISAEISSLFQRMPGCRLHNHYGPTETHVVTALTLDVEPRHWPALPSIGRPISNTRIHILDEQQQPMSLEAEGEIYIGGAGLARGYLGRPEITAKRFVRDPFSEDPQARLYATGDLGRWRKDGTVEYLGRNDDQVKIRGYRIELGEIETQLVRHPAVKDAAVVTREGVSGGKRLVAYITQRSVSAPVAEELRAFLKGMLPEYMIPSAFVLLEHLPMTPNGKLDRRALPEPDIDAYTSGNYEPPQGMTEEAVARVWQSVLGVERVGRNDNFFEVGGHSLMGVKIARAIGESLNVQIESGVIFECPSIREMARRIDQAVGSRPLPLTLRLSTDRVPLTYAQRWLWNEFELIRRPSMRLVTEAVRIYGHLHWEALYRSFTEVIRRHEALRTRILVVNGIPEQCIDAQVRYDLPVEDLSNLPRRDAEAQTQRIIAAMSCEPVDVSEGPLLMMRLVKLSEHEHVLAIAIDHIASDGTSLGIVVRELFGLYEQCVRGQLWSLPKGPVQFADYAVWQNKTDQWWSDHHGLYWKERLAGAKHLRVFADDVRNRGTRNKMAIVPIRFEEALCNTFRIMSRRERTTPALTILTAYIATLMRWCNERDIVVQFVTLGRSEHELESTVGCFGAPLYLRVALQERDRFVDLLHRVTDEYATAIAHGDAGRVAAQVPQPEYEWNPSFNWLPQQLGTAIRAPAGDLTIDRFESEFAFRDDLIDWDMEPRLSVAETPAGVAGTILYRADRCLAATIERFQRSILSFANHFAGDPNARVWGLQA